MRLKKYFCAVLALCLMLTSCVQAGTAVSASPEPSATPERVVSIEPSSFTSSTLLDLTIKLMEKGLNDSGNTLVDPISVSSAMAVSVAASGANLQTSLLSLMGAQGLSAGSVYEKTLERRNMVTSYEAGSFVEAWQEVVFENIAIKENFISTVREKLALDVVFKSLTADSASSYYNSFADDTTYGKFKKTTWQSTTTEDPVLIELSYRMPIWVNAQDPTKTVPVPFYYEDGTKTALSMMPVVQQCGINVTDVATTVIIPMAKDEYRLVLVLPEENVELSDLLYEVYTRYAAWLRDAQWGENRIVIPKLSLVNDMSLKDSLRYLGASAVFDIETPLTSMGVGLRFSDMFTQQRFVLDESGDGVVSGSSSYRPGIDDGINTVLMNRRFLFFLEDTDTQTILCAGIIRDPMQ